MLPLTRLIKYNIKYSPEKHKTIYSGIYTESYSTCCYINNLEYNYVF